MDRQCDPDVELLLRSHYLLREFTSGFVIPVYIPPDAIKKKLLQALHEVICSHMTKQSDGVLIVAANRF